jgi:hypothetical protein
MDNSVGKNSNLVGMHFFRYPNTSEVSTFMKSLEKHRFINLGIKNSEIVSAKINDCSLGYKSITDKN